jgi:[ribosomal protein S5]-alanine N-acetyltransferase
MHFAATTGHHTVDMDYPIAPGAAGEGPRPLEMLLATLASCAGGSLSFLLRRAAQPFTGLTVVARGVRRSEHPTVFTQIHLEFLFEGSLDERVVRDSLEQAEAHICPVWAMLKPSTPITASFRITPRVDPPARIATSRLELVAATVALLDAELASNGELARLIGADVPEGWPPGEYDRPAIGHFRDRLRENPAAAGWYGWYAVQRPAAGEPAMLVGAGGFFGPPDGEGTLEIGYSIVPAFEGKGLATELVNALVGFAFSDGRVSRIIAHTSPANIGSIRVLDKAGFAEVGAGREPGMTRYQRLPPTTR